MTRSLQSQHGAYFSQGGKSEPDVPQVFSSVPSLPHPAKLAEQPSGQPRGALSGFAVASRSINFTKRDLDILLTLTSKVPVSSLSQLASVFFPSKQPDLKAARDVLKRMVRFGFLHRSHLPCQPIIDVAKPIFAWKPGGPAPNTGNLAHRLKVRWTCALVPTEVYFATRRSHALFGGSKKKLRPIQVSHDLQVAAVYYHFLTNDPERASAWHLEVPFKLDENFVKIPDAFIKGTRSEDSVLIEIGGRYSSDRLREFHQFATILNHKYEIW